MINVNLFSVTNEIVDARKNENTIKDSLVKDQEYLKIDITSMTFATRYNKKVH